VLFKDIIPASVYERTDNNLKDATGYNAEVGMKGEWKGFHFNVGLFKLVYRNRMGSLVMSGADGQAYILKTNVGDSRNVGIEALVEGPLWDFGKLQFSWFSSTAHIDARYHNAKISTGSDNKPINRNKVESVPGWTSRNGLTAAFRMVRLTVQYSYVGKTFSDAFNTPVPQPNGAKGPVPAYSLWDINSGWQVNSRISVRASVNNVLDKKYFTKRPTFYPGPGIWPSDGRGAVVSVGINI